MPEIVTVIEILVEESPVRDQSQNQNQDRDRARARVPARDPAAIAPARAHHGAAHPTAGAFAPRISIARSGSPLPKIAAGRNLDRPPDREADRCGYGFN